MNNYDNLKTKLIKYGQVHLLAFWDELSDEEREILISDINELNLEEIQSFFKRATDSLEEESQKLDDRIEAVPVSLSINRTDKEQLKLYEEEGLHQIANNHVGVLLMAGGQGTRLGFAHPKGMFDIGLPSHKTLFQIQGERILKLQELAKKLTNKQGYITWYIMTSKHTMVPTKTFFKDNNYFGLREQDILMFEQGSLPCFGFDGKILLDEKHRISKAPDGNGGLYRALRDGGILDDLNERGVLYLHAHSVDNILIKVADPIFIGYCVKCNVDCAAKVVEKAQPNEAVGVVCMVDGKYQVVEYSEITTKTAEMRNPDGRLTFSAGNICNHFFSSSFLNKIGTTFEKDLKLHVAKKKIPFVNDSGIRTSTNTPNGIKIEKFVFDVFEFADNFVTVEVLREEEFSALKNADSAGKDCATTARKDLFQLHRKYIENAGGFVEGIESEIEISPLLSYAGEGLEDVARGKTFQNSIEITTS